MAMINHNFTEAEMPDRYLILRDRRLARDEYEKFVPVKDNSRIVLGRDAESNLILNNDPRSFVSRKHCEIYDIVYDESSSHVFVRDLGSHNGTWVNDVFVSRKDSRSPGFLLEDGDEIQIIPYWTLTFRDKRIFKQYALTDLQASEHNLFKDKYQISERCLGQGAEGVVCLATDVKRKKQLVCKIVNLVNYGGGADTQEQRRRKLQEADVLRQLRHPNILPYVDALVSPHSLYTFTELATGGDLWSYLHQHTSVGERALQFIVYQIVSALVFVHSKGVIHRDLKPENILLACSKRTYSNRVMLSDFGAYAVPRRSRMLTHAGTVNYQAPEIRDTSQPHTAAVDMWSLGVVALTILSHGTSFTVEGFDRMEQKHIDEALGSLPRKVPTKCRKFIRECLRIEPEKRMTAKQAWGHDWLLNPTFRRITQNMARSRQEQELQPMPCELPDLLDHHLSASAMQHHKLRLGERLGLAEGPDAARLAWFGPGSGKLLPSEAAVIFCASPKPHAKTVGNCGNGGESASSISGPTPASCRDGSVMQLTPENMSEKSLDDEDAFVLDSGKISQPSKSQPRWIGHDISETSFPLSAIDMLSEDVADQSQLAIQDLSLKYV
ncbi:hypothetical protein CDD82_3823 [Ophiocordyceps australis]|uniref:Serine/threonine protein kinase n=1 Tax=Ophiocordyceps australis TaxID=1399860 RepID=A0A2C5Y792_9HYPO|nr:hypothetical protein CDD82_3823 [Ophiocordyceps australis]